MVQMVSPLQNFKPFKKRYLKQLVDLFNLSLSSVVTIYKKDSKLDCHNYYPISLLFYIEKILEKLMYKMIYQFLTESNII